MSRVRNVLFICSRNRLRSPTAERVFANTPGIETASAGTAPDADEQVDADHLEWADVIFVMENVHRQHLTKRFGRHIKGKRIICLDVPDKFGLMDPALVALLETKVRPHLR